MNLLLRKSVYICEAGFQYRKGGDGTDTFEKLLKLEHSAVERFVRFRVTSKEDADDILQEVYLTAYQKFAQLKNVDAFRAWMISIARNKCNDYFRMRANQLEIPVEELSASQLLQTRYGISQSSVVRETLEQLGDRDKQILYLFFWKELPQAEIAERLKIPVGTVKSRIHTAKGNFKKKYPHHAELVKGENNMKKLPEYLPEYKIEASDQPAFCVKWEEMMGWFLIPKLGERLSWGMYEMPSRRCSHVYDLQVVGKAQVHGIEGVEFTASEAPYALQQETINRTFVAQLTDTHCRYLAAIRTDGDMRRYITFLDGDDFLPNWGYGEDNIGNETNLAPRGVISRSGNTITCPDSKFLLDIVGRYTVTLGGKCHDTVCVMDISGENCGVITEQFLDHSGRTVLWRRYNRDDWAMDRYSQKWSEQLPDNDRLTVNGTTYVHWYDCVTDYVL